MSKTKKQKPKTKQAHANAKRYSAKKKQQVQELAAAGLSAPAIAAKAKVGYETVRRWLRQSPAAPTVAQFGIEVPTGASTQAPTPIKQWQPSEEQTALAVALEEIRDLRALVGHQALTLVRDADGSRRPVDRVLIR